MRSSKLYSRLAFLVGAFSSFNISVLGLITVSELIMTLLFPVLLLFDRHRYISFSKNEEKTVKYIVLWIIAIIISDLFNGTPLNLFFKGVGHPLIILTSFIFFNRALQQSHTIIINFLLGLIIASCYYYYTDPIAQEQFRFGIFNIIISVVFVIIYYLWEKKYYKISYFMIILLMVIGFLNGGRSNGLNFFLLLVILYYSRNLNVKNAISFKNITKYIPALLISVVIIQGIYVLAVRNHMFPVVFQSKFEEQLDSGLPVILSGRTEIFASLEAIKDSPLIGHGSWKKDLKYTNIYYQKKKLDISAFDDTSRSYGFDKIPAHSFFFGAWVEHGLMAAFFFIFLGMVIFNILFLAMNNYKLPYTPFLIFLCVVYFWHLLFSPLGSDKRIFVALLLALNSYCVSNNSNK